MQRIYVAIAAVPVVPVVSWRLSRGSPTVMRQAARVFKCMLDYFNRTGRLEASLFDRDAEINQSAEILGTVGTFRGRAAWQQAMAEVNEALTDVRLVPERLIGVRPDTVVAFVRVMARGRASGVQVDAPIAIVMTIRRGRCGRLDIHRDRDSAVAAVGHPGLAAAAEA